MIEENIQNILIILKSALKKNDYKEDFKCIKDVVSNLNNLRIKSKKDLEELYNQIKYLDIKYDEFNDLLAYFTPVFIRANANIQKKEVQNLRIKNRNKRNGE